MIAVQTIRRCTRPLIGVALLIALIQGPTVSSAQESATLRVSSSRIGEGSTGAVTVQVEGVNGIYGADVQLRFDPTSLQAEDADAGRAGTQLRVGTFLSPDLVLRDSIDNETGVAHFAITQLNPSPARDGDGVLFTIVFRAIRPSGSVDIEVTSSKLATRAGEVIPHEIVPGSVTLVSDSEAPATPTPPDAPPPTPRIAPTFSTLAPATGATDVGSPVATAAPDRTAVSSGAGAGGSAPRQAGDSQGPSQAPAAGIAPTTVGAFAPPLERAAGPGGEAAMSRSSTDSDGESLSRPGDGLIVGDKSTSEDDLASGDVRITTADDAEGQAMSRADVSDGEGGIASGAADTDDGADRAGQTSEGSTGRIALLGLLAALAVGSLAYMVKRG